MIPNYCFCFHDGDYQVELTAVCKFDGTTRGLILLSFAHYESLIIHLLRHDGPTTQHHLSFQR